MGHSHPTLAHGDSDLERRMAMFIVDNAAELGMKTYLEIHPRVGGGSRVKWDRDPDFYELATALSSALGEDDLPVGGEQSRGSPGRRPRTG